MKTELLEIDSERLLDTMRAMKLNQKELAAKACVSREHLGKCIRSKRMTEFYLYQICKVLDISADYITGKTNVPFCNWIDDRNKLNKKEVLTSYYMCLNVSPDYYDLLSDSDIESIDNFLLFTMAQANERKEKES